ncbi:hypothetical protein D9757_002360 [Collybiopsis confluens]|uniref:Uncharacterized protein n=1 Tax=Collybiopsis confluens TaxID=2823264 RepID=A0A8H5HYL3_9AGAR|nr:hypothetical protein D9757_002360 [Collybiopsis confluens]
MYNAYTNNPFSSDNASARYPDLSASSPSPDPSASQFTSWMQPAGSQQQQPQLQSQSQPQHQQQQQYSGTGYHQFAGVAGGGGGSGFMSPAPFQPSSGFGQQMLGQMSGGGSSYNYLQGLNSAPPAIQTNYNPVQQQLQSPGYNTVSQFDPYSSLGQGWDVASAPLQQQHQSSSSSSSYNPAPTSSAISVTTSRSAAGGVHPREFIKTHKTEIESWDPYAWKQLFNSFDDLKESWGNRKKEVDGRAQQLLAQMQYSGGYHPQMQQEAERLRSLSREADTNHDSIFASSFQMREVFENYRKSGDQAGKRRVREASNAALQSLPDWPAPAF